MILLVRMLILRLHSSTMAVNVAASLAVDGAARRRERVGDLSTIVRAVTGAASPRRLLAERNRSLYISRDETVPVWGIDLQREAEAMGFDTIAVPDHLF